MTVPGVSLRVSGHCPACGSRSLVLIMPEGRLMCDRPACPRRMAAHEILSEPETRHVIEFDGSGFSIWHPLIERIDLDLVNCELHAWLASLEQAPVEPGRYRAEPDGIVEDGPWIFERMSKT